jgi:hypothetical protein
MDGHLATELAPTRSFKPVPMERLWPKRPSVSPPPDRLVSSCINNLLTFLSFVLFSWKIGIEMFARSVGVFARLLLFVSSIHHCADTSSSSAINEQIYRDLLF